MSEAEDHDGAECYYCATDGKSVKPCPSQPAPHCFDCHVWALFHGGWPGVWPLLLAGSPA